MCSHSLEHVVFHNQGEPFIVEYDHCREMRSGCTTNVPFLVFMGMTGGAECIYQQQYSSSYLSIWFFMCCIQSQTSLTGTLVYGFMTHILIMSDPCVYIDTYGSTI